MRKLLSLFLALCLMAGLSAFASADEAVFAGGSGTAEDPYQIVCRCRSEFSGGKDKEQS